MRILLIDGDKRSSAFLKQGLSSEGFAVDSVADAVHALKLAERVHYVALLVSGAVPEQASLAFLAALRKQRNGAAVLMYDDPEHGRTKNEAVLAALDGYIARPKLTDITERLYAALRRARHLESNFSVAEELRRGALRIDLDSRRVTWRGKEINLTKKEFELLEFLMRHPQRVLSQEILAQELWNIDYQGHSNVVQTLVKRLRSKFPQRGRSNCIETIRGFGYRLAV
jgi:DNA-binding response OmpR family regulator